MMPPLKLRRIPDSPQDPPRKTHGRTSGLGVMEFWHHLFELNEMLPLKDKMNDNSIVFQIEQEFPDRPQATQRIHERKATVGMVRWKFNAGILCSKKGKPRRKSFRYNQYGQRIDGRSRKTLPVHQQQKKRGKR